MTKEDLDKLSNILDFKMKEYIASVNLNAPTEKSRMIAELQKNNNVIIDHLNKQDIRMDRMEEASIQFRKQVQPLVDAFTDENTTKVVLGKGAIKVYQVSKWVAVVGGAIGALHILLEYVKSHIK